MPHKQTVTPCVVRLVVLRDLSPATQLQRQALRAGELEQATKGGTPSLARASRAYCQTFVATLETATERRRQAPLSARGLRRSGASGGEGGEHHLLESGARSRQHGASRDRHGTPTDWRSVPDSGHP
jgi:hypothetical protein